MSDDASIGGPVASVTSDGFTVSSNAETADQIQQNFESAPKPKDGESPDEAKEEQDRVSKAASELGRKGGKASAEAKKEAKATKDGDDDGDGVHPDKADEVKPDEKERPLGKPRDDPRARMLEATRQAAELKRQLAQEKAEREKLAAEVAQIRQAPRQERPEPEAPRSLPRRPDIRTYPEDQFEKYLDDRDQWNRMQWAAEHEQAQEQRRYHETLDSHVNGFSKAIAETRKTDPEFLDRISDEVLNLVPTFRLPQGQASTAANWIADDFVFSPEMAPALMLHFTEHPQDYQRIASLRTPRDVTREMARLTARLEVASAGAHSRPEVSKAKPPVRPVTGSPQTADPFEVTDDDTVEDHFRRMNAREHAARKGNSRL